MASIIQGLCPISVSGMPMDKWKGMNSERILDFIDRKYDVLVCTNIVESGVDIPNVNTIIVNNAHQFGPQRLHQLRGRGSPNNKESFCYLLAPPMSNAGRFAEAAADPGNNTANSGVASRLPCATFDIRGAGNLWAGNRAASWRRSVLKCIRRFWMKQSAN